MTQGLLSLRFGCDRLGRTRLLERRQQYPLTTTAVLPMETGYGALVYVQNAAGSVFGGDRLHIDVNMEADTALCLSTPSATRIQGGTLSIQTLRVFVGEGGFFESIPDMVIPHPNAMYRQETFIDLAAGAGAILTETLAPGRVARGEFHTYQSIALRLTVNVDGRTILRDAFRFQPDEASPALEGSLSSEGYVGSVFALTQTGESEELAACIDAGLVNVLGVYGGASPLASGHGAVARFLADDAPSLRLATQVAWESARQYMRGEPAPILRK